MFYINWYQWQSLCFKYRICCLLYCDFICKSNYPIHVDWIFLFVMSLMKDTKQQTLQLHCVYWRLLVTSAKKFLTRRYSPHETVCCTRLPSRNRTRQLTATSATKNQLNGPFALIQKVSKGFSTRTTWGFLEMCFQSLLYLEIGCTCRWHTYVYITFLCCN